MAAKRIRLSSSATEQLQIVRQRLRLDGRPKLWTLRIALARSIQVGNKFESSNSTEPSSNGFEIETSTLEQDDGILFRALLQQYYFRPVEDEEYSDLLKWHIEDGLNIITEQTQTQNGDDYLILMAQDGLTDKTNTPYADITVPVGFEDVISIRVGVDKETNSPIVINFNKTDEHSNNYIGIVGKPGSGKTYFGKYFLTELRKASRFKTNFIIFDYAKGDIADDDLFIRESRAEVLKIEETPIPLNLFKISDSKNLSDQKFNAEKIIETIRSVENIGKVQEQNLYEAIMNAYEKVSETNQPYPDFQLIRKELEAIKETPDSLTSIFRPLTEHNLFASRDMTTWDSFIDKTAVIDIHRLPAQKDLCVFLTLNEMYRQLMLMPDSKVDRASQAREMRTIIVLDEAHHFLKTKKRVQILEKIIREIRSKGASVMLLSQSPDDYNHAEFNFLELLEFVYVLGSSPSSYKFLEQTFGIGSNEAKKLIGDVNLLQQGEAFTKSRDKKYSQILLCK